MNDDEQEFTVTATTTITSTFVVYAEDEEDAREQVENATVTGAHNFDYGVTVSDATKIEDDGWTVEDVEAKR